jgi:hypothetical protein
MNAKLPNWQGSAQQILIGLALATIVVAVIEANSDYDEECGWSLLGVDVSHYGRGDRQKIRIGRGRCRLEVDLRGEVDFTADHRGVARLGPGASISVRERLRGERRRLDVEPGPGGEPEYTWYAGSLPGEFDDAARAWLGRNGYDERFGARPLARVIQETVKKPLADELLFGELQGGGRVRVVVDENDKLDFEFVTQDFLKGETKKTRRSTKKGGGAGKELVKG